jgi:hypothetical protein
MHWPHNKMPSVIDSHHASYKYSYVRHRSPLTRPWWVGERIFRFLSEEEYRNWYPKFVIKFVGSIKYLDITSRTTKAVWLEDYHFTNYNYITSMIFLTKPIHQSTIVTQRDKIYLTFHGTWTFITVIKRASHWYLWDSWLQYTHYFFKIRFNIILPSTPMSHKWSAPSSPTKILYVFLIKGCDSSVGIALGYGLENRNSRVRFPAGAGNFFLHHRVQNGSGAHPASYPMSTRGTFPRSKAAGAWSWQIISI